MRGDPAKLNKIKGIIFSLAMADRTTSDKLKRVPFSHNLCPSVKAEKEHQSHLSPSIKIDYHETWHRRKTHLLNLILEFGREKRLASMASVDEGVYARETRAPT